MPVPEATAVVLERLVQYTGIYTVLPYLLSPQCTAVTAQQYCSTSIYVRRKTNTRRRYDILKEPPRLFHTALSKRINAIARYYDVRMMHLQVKRIALFLLYSAYSSTAVHIYQAYGIPGTL